MKPGGHSVGLRQRAGAQDVVVGGYPEEKGEGGELRMPKRFRAFETRTVKSLPKIGNTEREVDLGYIEDVLFWVCADYSCGEV